MSDQEDNTTNEQLRNIVSNMQRQIDALTRTPQEGIDTSPQRDYYDDDEEGMEFLDYEDDLELYASQNEEFDEPSESQTNEQTDENNTATVEDATPSTSTATAALAVEEDIFSDIRIVSVEEDKGEKIKEDFARIILDSYNSKKDKENIKKLRQKYPLPENCQIPVPKLNIELWQLLNSLQRKSDVSMAMIQRNLISALSGVIRIIKNVLNEDKNKKELVQISSDVAGLIGQASKDIAFKRKLFIKSALKDEYKDLVSTGDNSKLTEKLFGENLTQNIKDLKLRNKLKNTKPSNFKQKSQYPKRNEFNPYNKNSRPNSFLGRGRGRMSSSTSTSSKRN